MVAVALVSIGRPTLAAPLPGDEPLDDSHKATAQALFDEGMELMEQGRVEEACRDFDESQHLDPAIGTRFNLADCYERLGRLASAWVHYVGVADAAARLGQHDRAEFARRRAEALEPRLSRLHIEVTTRLPGMTVQRDGQRVGAAQWFKAVPIDPGGHEIRVEAPYHEPWRVQITVDEPGATTTVVVPALQPTVVAQAEATVLPPPAEPVVPPPSTGPVDDRSRRGQMIAGLVVGGLGGATMVVGGSFGLVAIRRQDRSESACPQPAACFPAGATRLDEARRAGTASTVLLAVGGGLLATGVVLVVTAALARRRNATARGRSLTWIRRAGFSFLGSAPDRRTW